MSYGGSTTTISIPTAQATPPATTAKPAAKPADSPNGAPAAASPKSTAPKTASGAPDFKSMNSAERLAYHQERLKRMFGG